MKLVHVRLRPFGKFIDQSWDLSEPLVVVHGPNEAGKSTLRQAIVHALFTPTNLTPARLKQVMQAWFPLPAGDFAALQLTFEHEGSTWTLDKRWGAGAGCVLSDGRGSMADPEAVQARLAAIVEHDEATFRHLLFTGQAELERTLEALKKEAIAGTLRDIRDVMKAASGGSGDVDEQKLRRLLAEVIEASFSRWDDERERPERQAGEDRGIANPWRRDVGAILAAWYRWQRFVEERDAILGLEQEIDRVNVEASAIDRRLAELDSFEHQYGNLRSDLADRGQFEERVPRLEREVAAMREAFGAWPMAAAALAAWAGQRATIEERRERLDAERAHAHAREAGAATVAAMEAITKAKAAWDDAVSQATSLRDPGAEVLARLTHLESGIVHAENVLAARTLSWRIEAEGTEAVTVAAGDAPPSTVAVGPEGARGQAQGLVRVTVAGVTVAVTSGSDDVAALLATLAGHRDERARVLAECDVASVDAARRAAETAREARATATSRKQIYEGLLRGKTLAEWQAAIQSIAALPATRAPAEIEAEISTCLTQLASGCTAASVHEQAIAKWTAEFHDMESLGLRLLEAQRECKAAKDRLAAMPDVPTGFASAKAFLDALDQGRRERSAAEQKRSGAREELARLTEKLGDRRSEDAADQASLAERAYRRARATGQAYRRILTEVDRITAATSDNPLARFSERVADLFAKMTSAEVALEFGTGQLPTSVVRGAIAIAPERLSQGGGGALALAVRLAMAEAYLREGDGFIMLDDPLVHFDAARMAEAAAIIREFSGRSQVIFFTCHDHHAKSISG